MRKALSRNIQIRNSIEDWTIEYWLHFTFESIILYQLKILQQCQVLDNILHILSQIFPKLGP